MKAVRPSSCSRGDSAVAGSWRGDQELSPGHQKPTSSIVHAVSLSRKAFCQLRGLEYFLITCRERAAFLENPDAGVFLLHATWTLGPATLQSCTCVQLPHAPGCHSAASSAWATFPTLIFVLCRSSHFKEIYSET